MKELKDFLVKPNPKNINKGIVYSSTQLGNCMEVLDYSTDVNWDYYDIILLGSTEVRGARKSNIEHKENTLKIRQELYQLNLWHELKILDLGDLKLGKTMKDSYAALSTVLDIVSNTHSRIVLLGGSDDLLFSIYQFYKIQRKPANFTIIDKKIDMEENTFDIDSNNYIYSLLLDEPNFTNHLNIIGFQSYFVSSKILEVLDNLKFDFLRLGMIKEDIEQAEPMIRDSHVMALDMDALQYTVNPAGINSSPNGLDGQEVCTLIKYAGFSKSNHILGIFNYNFKEDVYSMSARLVAQMIWYYIEGVVLGRQEADFNNKKDFLNFSVEIDKISIKFKRSKRTNRWWMQVRNKVWQACTYQDYLEASKNILPERWLRAQERL